MVTFVSATFAINMRAFEAEIGNCTITGREAIEFHPAGQIHPKGAKRPRDEIDPRDEIL